MSFKCENIYAFIAAMESPNTTQGLRALEGGNMLMEKVAMFMDLIDKAERSGEIEPGEMLYVRALCTNIGEDLVLQAAALRFAEQSRSGLTQDVFTPTASDASTSATSE